MNFKTLVKLSLSVLFFVAVLSGVSFAQLSTVYVDVTNGSDTYSGANATNLPAGSGPKATLDAGLKAVAANGKIVLLAGTYNGVNNAGGAININTATYANLTDNSSLTIELRSLNSNNEVAITGGAFTFNVTGGTLNITSTNGTEYISLASGSVTLTAGNVNISNSNNFQLPANATINIAGAAAFTGAAPKKGTNVTLSYTGAGSITAGPESNYGDYGTGTITVNKAAASTTVFPYAISKVGSVTVTAGNVTFSNAVTTTGDITLTSGNNTFNGAVTAGGTITLTSGNDTFNGAVTAAAISQTAGNETFASTVTTSGDITLNAGTNVFSGAVTLGKAITAGVFPNDFTDAHLIINGGTATFAAVTVKSNANTLNDAITVANTANASFTGAVDVKLGDILVSTTGTVTFDGNVSLYYNDGVGSENELAQIVNSGAAVVSFNAATTWNGLVKLTAARNFMAAGFAAVTNSSTGSVIFNGVSMLNPNTAANATVPDANAGTVLNVVNSNKGILTLGAVTAPFATPSVSGGFTSNTYVTLHADNSFVGAGAGSLSLSGTIRGTVANADGTLLIPAATTIGGNLTNGAGVANVSAATNVTGAVSNLGTFTYAGGTISGALTNGNAMTFTGNVSVAGVFTNVAGKTLTIDGNNLTLTGAVAHLTNGSTVSATTGILYVNNNASINGGTLPAIVVASGKTLTFTANAASVASLTLNGSVTANINVTVAGATNIPTGSLTIADAVTFSTLNFTQNGGSVALGAGASGTLVVKGDFNRTAGTFTAGAGSLLNMNGTVAQNLNGGPLLQLVNLTFNNTTAPITLGQSVRASGTVNIAANTALVLNTLNIILNANNAAINNAGSYTALGGGGVIFGGVNTVSGGSNVSGTTIAGAGIYSYITVDVGAANTVTTASAKVKWNGVLTLKSGNLTVDDGNDFSPTGSSASIIRDVVNSTSGIIAPIAGGGHTGTFNADVPTDYDLTYIGTLGGLKQIVAGTSELDLSHVRNLTVSTTANKLQLASAGAVTVKGNLSLSDAALFDLESTAPFDFEVKGVFSAGKASVLSGGDAAKVFKLSSNSLTHTVLGTISAASPLTVSGTGVVVNGTATSSAAASGYEAVLQDVTVANNGSLTLANIQQIKGSLVAGTTSTLSVGLVAPDNGDGIVYGAVTLNGTSATLTSDVEVRSGLTHNKGSFDFGGKILTMTTAGNYVRANDATAVYPSATGTLVLNLAGLSLNMNNGSIPNLEVKANTTIGGLATVSNLFKHTTGAVAVDNALSIAGNMTYTAGTYAGADTVKFIGAASVITAAGNMEITNVTVNSTGTVTFASNNATARTLTVTGLFANTAGTFALGANDLSLTKVGAALAGTTGTFSASTGRVIFAGAGAQTFAPGTGLVIPNLTIATTAGTVTNTTPTVGFTVSKSLVLNGAGALVTNAGTLSISDAATIERKLTTSTLSTVPTFGANLNYIYSGAAATGNELAPVVNNITISNAATLSAPVQANGTLALSAAFTTTSPNVVTLGAGALLQLNAAGSISAPVVPTGALNLVYNGVAATSNNDWPATANIGSLTIKAATDLHAARTVNGTVTLNGGNLDLKGFTLTVKGDVTASTGNFFTASAASNLIFAGNSNTNLTLTETKSPAANLSIKLAKTTGTNTVTLVGGSLDFHANGSTLYFGNGLIVTGENYVKLYAPLFMNGQGFDRTAVAASNTSHIVGNVKKQLVNNGTIVGSTEYRVEFPVGSAAMYRPAAVTFNPINGMSNVPNTTLTVSHVDAAPTGKVGLPIANGVAAGVDVARYPNFYWNLNSAPSSISPSVAFDLELGAAGFTNFDNVTNVRTIRRNGTTNDVTNPWLLQGGTSSLQYDNNVINSVPTIVVKNAQAGIIAGGAVYTLGLKSSLTVAAPIADKSVTVGAGVTKVVLSSPAVFAGNTGALTYTAQSSNNSVATVAVNGDTLKVTAVAQGSAEISVTAQDANEDFLTTKFKFSVTQPTNFAVSGKVSYDNTAATALKGVKVTLTSGAKTYTATTDSLGNYSIAAVENGTYAITATSTAVWGGVNATDALLVANYYNGSQTLTPLRVAAADVNNSSTVNNTDALQILRRYNNLVTSFAKGDWTFSSPSITVNGVAVTNANVTGIAVGDVNGSYAPAASLSKATLSSAGSINVNPGAQISIPVNADVQNLGAASMTFRYAKDLATFAGVSSKLEGVVYNENDGVITVAWANLGKEVVNVNDETGFITLNFKPTDAMKAGKSFGVELDGAELATSDAKVINNAILKTSDVKVVVPSEFALSQNYPNPFNPTTTINYDLPVNSRVSLVVFDVLGREVAQLVNGMQDAGSYKIQFNASNLTSGIYFYTLNVSGDKKFVKTYKMMLMK